MHDKKTSNNITMYAIDNTAIANDIFFENQRKCHSVSNLSSSEKEHFEQLLPPEKKWFSPKEVAEIVGCSDQHIRNAIDEKMILCHNLKRRGCSERRTTHLISREGVVLFLMETANYRPNEFMTLLKCVIQSRPRHQLKEIGNWIQLKLELV